MITPQVSQPLVYQTTLTSALFKNMNSKVAIATILSFAYDWDQTSMLFRLLSKKAHGYFALNAPQMRHFIHDKAIKKVALGFGDVFQ